MSVDQVEKKIRHHCESFLQEKIRQRMASIKCEDKFEVRILTNMVISSVNVKDSEGGEAYITAHATNLNGVLFFEDLTEIENQIKKSFEGAWNLAVVQYTRDNLSFSFVVPWKSLVF